MRKPKIHFRHAHLLVAVCGNSSHKWGGGHLPLTDNLAEVSCKNCLKQTVNKTREQGGPKENHNQYTVFLRANGPNRINVIKVIRAQAKIGLREAKDISDFPFYYNKDVKIIGKVSLAEANAVKDALVEAGATVFIDDGIGGAKYFSGLPERAHAALHILWTKAVGTPNYEKAEWQELEQAIAEATHGGGK